jgi:hypothetical protein
MALYRPIQADIQAGWWLSSCCWEDLQQIQPDDVLPLQNNIADSQAHNESVEVVVWPTKKEALIALSQGESSENVQRLYEVWGRPETW